MQDRPWYREFFGEDYFRIYRHLDDPERCRREVQGIERILGLSPGSAVLDLCCGHGRHVVPLAQRGFRMTGLDLSGVFLRRAKEEAEAAGVSVRWVRADVRAIPFENEFDAVINIFTAFGYLEDEEEDQEVLRQVARALKPGGLFLLESIHRDGLLPRLQPASISRNEEGLLQLEERAFDVRSSRIRTRLTLIEPDGRRKEYRHEERLYTAAELGWMFRRAGIDLIDARDGLDAGPLTLESRRMALLGRKRRGEGP